MMIFAAPLGTVCYKTYRARYGRKQNLCPAVVDLSTWTALAYGNLPLDGTRMVRAVRQDSLAEAFGVDWWEVD